MFHAETVFILGAGASWHYYYPTGEELVKQVQDKAVSAAAYFEQATRDHPSLLIRPDFVKRRHPDPFPNDDQLIPSSRAEFVAAASEAKALASKLAAVDPLVIDYFIGHNIHLEDIAKLCIAWKILECEPSGARGSSGHNWCRFVIHKLVAGCPNGPSLLANRVHFITFNYDLSLEHRLSKGLSSLELFADVAAEFLGGDRIMHVYGSIREEMGDAPAVPHWDLRPGRWEDGKKLLDHVFKASQGIKTISPEKSALTDLSATVKRIQQLIADAECVYILGYGFDEINSKLLDLPNSLRVTTKRKRVLFTNYKNRGIVNKNASRIFFNGNSNALLEERGQVIEYPPFACEKSINDVYHALAYDFDNPEERPTVS